MAGKKDDTDAVEEKIAAVDQLIPSAWFLTELDGPTEERVAEIVARATR